MQTVTTAPQRRSSASIIIWQRDPISQRAVERFRSDVLNLRRVRHAADILRACADRRVLMRLDLGQFVEDCFESSIFQKTTIVLSSLLRTRSSSELLTKRLPPSG
jgi:hypothetical protein